MKADIVFGEWLPDLPAEANPGLVVAQNVYATPNGYRPVKAVSAITTALADFNGGAAFIGLDGTASLLAGTTTNLQRYSSSWSAVRTIAASGRWNFAQFGDLVICVFGGAPQKYNLLTGAAAALSGSPPNAGLVTTVRDFVVLAGNSAANDTLQWSAFNNAEGWTIGTDQSDDQRMLVGGAITGLAGGEYGLILQRNRVTRMQYVGGGLVFQFDEIADNVGCIASGSVVQIGKLVFFLSERGFMMCDGSTVTPIGTEKIDRTFFAANARETFSSMYAAADPRNFIVAWALPGNPGTVLLYNWALQRWSSASLPLKGIFTGFTSNVSLEGVDALYPSGIDSVVGSLDDAIFSGGNPLLLVAGWDTLIGPMTGTNLTATFQTGLLEPVPGRFARVANTTPLTDAVTGVTVTMDARQRAGTAGVVTSSTDLRNNGDVPMRANGRYFYGTLAVIDPACSYVRGIRLDVNAAGAQ